MMGLTDAHALLDEAAIPFDESSDPAALGEALAPRLEALLALHGLSPTADGWRMLALRLAVDRVKLQAPVRGDKGGRPSIVRHEVLFAKLRRMRTAMTGAGGRPPASIDVARAYIAANRQRRGGPALPSLKVLQTVMTDGDAGRLPLWRLLPALVLDRVRDAAMDAAARVVESRNDPP